MLWPRIILKQTSNNHLPFARIWYQGVNNNIKYQNYMGFFNYFSSHNETPKQPQSSEEQLQLDMFPNLSQTQKFAIVSMLASLAAAPANAERISMAQKMMFTDAAMIGITQDMMLNYMQTQNKPNAQMVISTLGTITDTKVLEWLIYCGFSIIVVNQNEKACSVFFDWWHKLGYEPEDIDRVVKEIEAICNKMRQIINL